MPPFLAGLAGKLIIGAVVVSSLFGYWMHLKSEISTLEKNNMTLKINTGKLDDAIAVQKSTIEKMKKDFVNIEKSKNKIEAEKKKSEKKVVALKKKFNKITKSGKKRDLNNIAQRKPKMFEKIINRASIFRNRCLEIATGSLVTESDSKNTVCPELVKPNVE